MLDRTPSNLDTAAEATLRAIGIASGHYSARALHLVADLGLADLIGSDHVSCSQLAATAGVDERALLRILRMLAPHDVFVEAEDQLFTLGLVGHALRSGGPFDAATAVRMLARSGMWAAADNLAESVRSGAPTLESRRNKPLYQADAPDRADRLAAAMAAFSAGLHERVATDWDFSSASLVVDVGGSTGLLLESVLRANSHLGGLLFDRPPTADLAERRLAAVGLADRCRVIGGDFFHAVPAGGDVYVLAHVVLDWGDSDAVRILANIRHVLGPQGRLLIIEPISGEAGSELHAGMFDAILMTATWGGCRSRQEHGELLARAGLTLRSVTPLGRIASLIEAVVAD
ncbi:methyltransferase [Sphingosinicella sp. BN140058]|uniref:methyltransferase n=1 Tax=Sphingosinicella sp. BN140058 TaxID=1892855 RepID=UPI001011BC0A|nr:methyltransferase [Sphingosinicella sp. BN140058]QAY78802.1 hypothetical protein ETR14_21380 [Sphingosinicella sp. BN140058]